MLRAMSEVHREGHIATTRLGTGDIFLWVCDIQEKFSTAVTAFDRVALGAETLARAMPLAVKPSGTLRLVVTEQVPEKLGTTVSPLMEALRSADERVVVHPKTAFSMYGSSELTSERYEPIYDIVAQDGEGRRKKHVIVGLEAHVCVLQTALDLRRHRPNDDVFVCADAVSSIRLEDRAVALRRMQAAGVIVTCTESVIFELLEDAKHQSFREVSKLVRESAQRAQALSSAPLPSI